MMIYNSNIKLANNNVYTKFGLILMSMKGLKPVANLQKTIHHNPNVDLVNNNVNTKLGYDSAILSRY